MPSIRNGIGIDRTQLSGGYNPITVAHITRVAQQGGTIDSPALLNLYVQYLVTNGLMSSQYIGAIPSVTGYKEGSVAGNCQIVFSVDPARSTTGSYIGDMVQNTVVNQPKLLKYSGERYAKGYFGGYITTSSYTSINNRDFDWVITVKADNDSVGALFSLEWTALNGVGTTLIRESDGSYTINHSGVTHTGFLANITLSSKFWVKLECIAMHQYNLYFSNDGIVYGAAILANFSSSGGAGYDLDILYVSTDKITNGTDCNIYDFTYNNATNGNNFKLDLAAYNHKVSETTWTATTGETWTLNRPVTNATAYQSTIVTRTKYQVKNSIYLTSGTIPFGTDITFLDIRTLLMPFLANDAALFQGQEYLKSTIFYSTNSGIHLGYLSGATLTQPSLNKNTIFTFFRKDAGGTKAQENKGTIVTAAGQYDSGALTQIRQIGYVDIYQTASDINGFISLSGDSVSDNNLKDFLNTTIFNGEIY